MPEAMMAVVDQELKPKHLVKMSQQQQQQLLMVDGLGQLHHYVVPENIPELEAIHASAPVTATVYIISVIVLYFVGLSAIFIHHMNSAYGSWAWGLSDAYDELRPLWAWTVMKRQQANSPRRKARRKKTSRFNENDEEIVDEVDEIIEMDSRDITIEPSCSNDSSKNISQRANMKAGRSSRFGNNVLVKTLQNFFLRAPNLSQDNKSRSATPNRAAAEGVELLSDKSGYHSQMAFHSRSVETTVESQDPEEIIRSN